MSAVTVQFDPSTTTVLWNSDQSVMLDCCCFVTSGCGCCCDPDTPEWFQPPIIIRVVDLKQDTRATSTPLNCLKGRNYTLPFLRFRVETDGTKTCVWQNRFAPGGTFGYAVVTIVATISQSSIGGSGHRIPDKCIDVEFFLDGNHDIEPYRSCLDCNGEPFLNYPTNTTIPLAQFSNAKCDATNPPQISNPVTGGCCCDGACWSDTHYNGSLQIANPHWKGATPPDPIDISGVAYTIGYVADAAPCTWTTSQLGWGELTRQPGSTSVYQVAVTPADFLNSIVLPAGYSFSNYATVLVPRCGNNDTPTEQTIAQITDSGGNVYSLAVDIIWLPEHNESCDYALQTHMPAIPCPPPSTACGCTTTACGDLITANNDGFTGVVQYNNDPLTPSFSTHNDCGGATSCGCPSSICGCAGVLYTPGAFRVENDGAPLGARAYVTFTVMGQTYYIGYSKSQHAVAYFGVGVLGVWGPDTPIPPTISGCICDADCPTAVADLLAPSFQVHQVEHTGETISGSGTATVFTPSVDPHGPIGYAIQAYVYQRPLGPNTDPCCTCNGDGDANLAQRCGALCSCACTPVTTNGIVNTSLNLVDPDANKPVALSPGCCPAYITVSYKALDSSGTSVWLTGVLTFSEFMPPAQVLYTGPVCAYHSTQSYQGEGCSFDHFSTQCLSTTQMTATYDYCTKKWSFDPPGVIPDPGGTYATACATVNENPDCDTYCPLIPCPDPGQPTPPPTTIFMHADDAATDGPVVRYDPGTGIHCYSFGIPQTLPPGATVITPADLAASNLSTCDDCLLYQALKCSDDSESGLFMSINEEANDVTGFKYNGVCYYWDTVDIYQDPGSGTVLNHNQVTHITGCGDVPCQFDCTTVTSLTLTVTGVSPCCVTGAFGHGSGTAATPPNGTYHLGAPVDEALVCVWNATISGKGDITLFHNANCTSQDAVESDDLFIALSYNKGPQTWTLNIHPLNQNNSFFFGNSASGSNVITGQPCSASPSTYYAAGGTATITFP